MALAFTLEGLLPLSQSSFVAAKMKQRLQLHCGLAMNSTIHICSIFHTYQKSILTFEPAHVCDPGRAGAFLLEISGILCGPESRHTLGKHVLLISLHCSNL